MFMFHTSKEFVGYMQESVYFSGYFCGVVGVCEGCDFTSRHDFHFWVIDSSIPVDIMRATEVYQRDAGGMVC